MVVLGLMTAGPARGGETPPAKPASAAALAKKAAESTGAETPKKAETGKSEKEPSAMETELQQLRELLREQQQRIEALEETLRKHPGSESAAPGSASVSLEAVAQNQEELDKKVGKVEKELADTKKSVESKIKGFGPFTFSGDLRARYENVFGGLPLSGPSGQAQHRERYRLRLNANAKFNDEFSGGFSLASGDLNNPVSTNQTINQFYIRRTIGIDRAFIAYHPGWFTPLTVTAGKFAYTWYRT
jgi:hypothetical protein